MRNRMRRHAAKPPAPGSRLPPVPPALARALLGIWVAALVLAPPLATWSWGVAGFRGVEPVARVAIAGAAILLGWVAWRGRGSGTWTGVAIVLALALAGPLRERAHVLGDTDLRLHAIADFAAHSVRVPLLEWSRR